MAQKILDDQKYEPKKEDFIDKIPETIPEGRFSSRLTTLFFFSLFRFVQKTNPSAKISTKTNRVVSRVFLFVVSSENVRFQMPI